MPLSGFHPVVRDWFAGTLGEPTAAQSRGWAAIREGRHTLIAAPTGSGKTLAAFLSAIDDLTREALQGPLPDEVRVLYVSPLKALAVDIERNLRAPIAGISRVAATRGETLHVPAIAIRTGDTPASERARFQRQPSDLLITTPESLYLLLTSRARDALRSIDTVIVDEIHALLPTKRGAHLALSLERLERPRGDCLEARERQRQVRAAARADDGVNLVHDHGPHRAQHRSAPLRRQQEVQRLGRRDEDMRRRADHRRPLGRRRVAGPHGAGDLRRRKAAHASALDDRAPGFRQVLLDVGAERLQRRDVQHAHFVRQRAFERFAREVVDRAQERRERLTGSGRRGDERVPTVADRGPAAALGGRRLAEGRGEPVTDDGMETGQGHCGTPKESRYRSFFGR